MAVSNTACLTIGVALTAYAGARESSDRDSSPIVLSEFIDERAPYPSANASTIVEAPDALVAGGWKGRGLWSTVSTRTPFHMEGSKGTPSKVIKFQLRPDPLAK